MINLRKYSFLVFGALCLLAHATCEVDCGCGPEETEMGPCQCFDTSQDVLVVADFENEGLPNFCGGGIGTWKDPLSSIEVWALADSIETGLQGSKWYAKIALVGNDGHSSSGWTGAGLTLTLTPCKAGVDLSNYDSLQFEVKTSPSSNLGEIRVKLQDIVNDSIPERYLFRYGHFPSLEWKKISIPLDEFSIKYASDTILHNWVALDPKSVESIVFVMVNNQPALGHTDGVLWLDNFRLVKQ